jgi:hypothetical protein
VSRLSGIFLDVVGTLARVPVKISNLCWIIWLPSNNSHRLSNPILFCVLADTRNQDFRYIDVAHWVFYYRRLKSPGSKHIKENLIMLFILITICIKRCSSRWRLGHQHNTLVTFLDNEKWIAFCGWSSDHHILSATTNIILHPLQSYFLILFA